VNDLRYSGTHLRSALTKFGRPGWRRYQPQAASTTRSNSLTSKNSAVAATGSNRASSRSSATSTSRRRAPQEALPGAAGYHAVFGAAVPFMVLALILALVMPEKPLSEEMIEVAEGKAEVPEY
jgi:hypothetical protein